MQELFSPEGKIIYYGTKFANLMWLQILTLLCCIPVFTAGAAFTAMHKILLQIYRDEEVSITKTYFKAFLANVRQATVIWLGCLVIFILLYLDYQITNSSEVSVIVQAMRYFIPIALVVVLACLSWVFVLLSRYNNTILGTVRMSFVACLAHPLYTILMAVLMIMPLLLLLLSWRLVPIVVLLGFTAPGILRTVLYSKVFDDLEDTDWRARKAEEQNADGEEASE